MSNSNDSKKPKNKAHPNPISKAETSAGTAASLTAAPAQKAKRWGLIKSDLQEALNTWDELESEANKLSPEEEQLQKIKTIIGQLKDKLEQF